MRLSLRLQPDPTYLLYSHLPSAEHGEVGRARAGAGDGIPLWKKVELHLLACLGKALKFPVRFSQKLIM